MKKHLTQLRGLTGPVLILVALWFGLDWLGSYALASDGPTAADAIAAWAAKGALAALLGILMPLLIIGAIRRSPMQEWLLPNADELQHAADALEEKLREGAPLTAAESQVLAGLAIRSGLTVLAVLVFAGLLVLRM